MLYAGQTLIVTGASLGIGRSLALGLANRGLNLVLNARHGQPLQEAAEECRCGQTNVATVAGNVGQDEVARALVDTALSMGDFLGFIHAAGVLHPGPYLWELSSRQQAEVLDSTLLGGLNLIRHALPPLLRAGQGLAVLLGSEATEQHTPGLGVYSAANAAQEHLIRQLAAETQGVTPLLYNPGPVDSQMQLQGREAQGSAAQILRQTFESYRDQGLLVSPERSAELLLTTLDGQWGWLHGQVLNARTMLEGKVTLNGADLTPVCHI